MASQHSDHPGAPDRASLVRRRLVVGLIAALTALPVVVSTTPGAAETMVHPGMPTLDGAETALAEATANRTEAMERKQQLQADLASTRQEISALGLEQVALIHELEVARHRVRVVTVRAYTNAGGGQLDLLTDPGDIGDHLFRSELMTNNVLDTSQAIEDYHDLQEQADDHAVELAESVDDIQAGIEDASADIADSARQITRAQVELSAARAAVAQNASGHGDPGEAAWERLRFCESGGVYTTNTGNGFYGAYQFDLQTWASMGGHGQPSAAPYWEQDIRAKALYWARGDQPWPICGRFVR
jgi:hypothetical protein